MLSGAERAEIGRLWTRKPQQDASGLPQRPPSSQSRTAQCGVPPCAGGWNRRQPDGRDWRLQRDLNHRVGGGRARDKWPPALPRHRTAAPGRSARYSGAARPGFVCGFHAGGCSPCSRPQTASDLALIDCEKDDYIRFFDMLPMRDDGIIVANNIISHSLVDYVAHVRSRPGAESITLAIGKELGIHRPAYSIGIQKKIYRHAFTLDLANSPGTTVSQRAGTNATFLGEPSADTPSASSSASTSRARFINGARTRACRVHTHVNTFFTGQSVDTFVEENYDAQSLAAGSSRRSAARRV